MSKKPLPVKIRISTFRIGFAVDFGITKEYVTEPTSQMVPIRLETGEIMCSESGNYIILENIMPKYKKK